jgi:C1A family cysteine protease
VVDAIALKLGSYFIHAVYLNTRRSFESLQGQRILWQEERTKMQSWADIASDSDDDEYHPANKVQEPEPEPEPEPEEEPEPPPTKSYDWPSDPPFTAYVGNLAFSVKDADEMTSGVTNLLQQRFQAQISIVNSRLAIDRQENKPRGFGYLEVETVDDVSIIRILCRFFLSVLTFCF